MMQKKGWIKYLILSISLLLFAGAFILFLLTNKWYKPSDKSFTLLIVRDCFFAFSSIFLITTIFFLSFYKYRSEIKILKKRLDNWSEVSFHISELSDDVVNALPVGILVTDSQGHCEWLNQNMINILGKNAKGQMITDISIEFKKLFESKEEKIKIAYRDENYDVVRKTKNNAFFFFNETEREKIADKYYRKSLVIAFISLDNFDGAISSLDVANQSSTRGLYFSALSDWALKYNSFLKTYDNEKLLLITNREALDHMIEDEFDILETIRNISFKNDILVTLSMGIVSWELELKELALYAQNAIELAEKRGGDQVVVNIENQEIKYFGAKVSQENSGSKVTARVISEKLKKIVNDSSSVFVMGHVNTDTDSYASMIATYNLIKKEGKENTYIVMEHEKLDPTVSKIAKIVESEMPELLNVQLRSEEAIQKADNNSLLIIVDTQNKKLVSSQSVFDKIKNKVIIDHHRATDDSFTGVLEYTESSSSSTAELLVEIIDFYSLNKNKITPLIASILYSGMLVDTNNFAYRTGVRTFAAASKIKEYGADINMVRKWLRKDTERLFEINDLVSKAELLYKNKIAITYTDKINNDLNFPAQLADELLQINNVEASFAIVRISENKIAVSARSLGQVNVQIIMEQLGGGGHFTAAATKFIDETIENVLAKLKQILDLDFLNEGELMKIILLEDVKNKGHKNDVIEVTNGYGTFLINQNQAVLATQEALKELENLKIEAEKIKEQKAKMLKALAHEIENKEVLIKVQIGAGGKMFGSVTTKDIADEFLKQNKIAIEKKKIKLNSEISGIGIYTAVLDLSNEVNAKFLVKVEEK